MTLNSSQHRAPIDVAEINAGHLSEIVVAQGACDAASWISVAVFLAAGEAKKRGDDDEFVRLIALRRLLVAFADSL